jgi:hypothetical protein
LQNAAGNPLLFQKISGNSAKRPNSGI